MITLYMKNQKPQRDYNAKAKYYNHKIIVLKGSKINSFVSNSPTLKYSKRAIEARNNKKIVDKNYIVQEDVEFTSATAAAQFVCGYSITGMQSWKNEKNISLKELIGD